MFQVPEPRLVVGDAVDDVVTDAGGCFDAAPDDLGGVSKAEVYGGAASIRCLVFRRDSAQFDADDGHAVGFGVVASHDFAGYFGDAVHSVRARWRIDVDASRWIWDVVVAGFDH